MRGDLRRGGLERNGLRRGDHRKSVRRRGGRAGACRQSGLRRGGRRRSARGRDDRPPGGGHRVDGQSCARQRRRGDRPGARCGPHPPVGAGSAAPRWGEGDRHQGDPRLLDRRQISHRWAYRHRSGRHWISHHWISRPRISHHWVYRQWASRPRSDRRESGPLQGGSGAQAPCPRCRSAFRDGVQNVGSWWKGGGGYGLFSFK